MSTWEQLDAWAAKQTEQVRDQSPPPGYTPTKERATQNRNVARGKHPMGLPLADNGETCGTCRHSTRKHIRSGKTFLKCLLTEITSGAATDIRAKWAACEKWEAEEF